MIDLYADTTVLILSGGRGTRLRPVFSGSPKPLAPINSQPFLFFLIDYISRFGFKNFVLCAGYKSTAIARAVRSWSAPRNLEISISSEPKPLGTAGAIKHAQPYISSKDFIVINGDTFLELDYEKYLDNFMKFNPIAQLALYPLPDQTASGSVIIDDKNRITGFIEKSAAPADHSYANAGVYFFNQIILNLIKRAHSTSLEYDILPQLINQFHNRVIGFIAEGDFVDIGTPANYRVAQTLLRKHQKI